MYHSAELPLTAGLICTMYEIWYVYKACMSLATSRSLLLQHVKLGDMLEICDGIIFEFYPRLPHILARANNFLPVFIAPPHHCNAVWKQFPSSYIFQSSYTKTSCKVCLYHQLRKDTHVQEMCKVCLVQWEYQWLHCQHWRYMSECIVAPRVHVRRG